MPAALDGEDATFAETAVIAAELGRAAAASPYLGTVALGAGTLNLLDPAPAGTNCSVTSPTARPS